MRKLQLNFRHQKVYELSKKLRSLGFKIYPTSVFTKNTENAVKSFQKQNQLLETGIVDQNTWNKIEMCLKERTFISERLLTVENKLELSKKYSIIAGKFDRLFSLQPNQKAFLNDGRPSITFYPAQFWKELSIRGINPKRIANIRNHHLLNQLPNLEKCAKRGYEYLQLEAAASIAQIPGVQEAAYCATAWGRFQIMGFEFQKLGFPSVFYFASTLYQNEYNHIDQFLTLIKEENLLSVLQKESFEEFETLYKRKVLLSAEYSMKLVLRNNHFVYR